MSKNRKEALMASKTSFIFLCLLLVLASPLAKAESSGLKVFQPGEVIRADEINQNFQEVYELAGQIGSATAGLFWATSSSTFSLDPGENLLPVECPNFITRIVSRVHLIPGVCNGDCGVQLLSEGCSQYHYFRGGRKDPAPSFPEGSSLGPDFSVIDPMLVFTSREQPVSIAIACQKLSGELIDGEICDPNDASAWKVLSREVRSTVISNEWHSELLFPSETNPIPNIAVRVRFDGVIFKELTDRVSFEINGKTLILPRQLETHFSTLTGSCGDKDEDGNFIFECYSSAYAKGVLEVQ